MGLRTRQKHREGISSGSQCSHRLGTIKLKILGQEPDPLPEQARQDISLTTLYCREDCLKLVILK
jgi:hypothetical protein